MFSSCRSQDNERCPLQGWQWYLSDLESRTNIRGRGKEVILMEKTPAYFTNQEARTLLRQVKQYEEK